MAWVDHRGGAAVPATRARVHRWSERADDLAVEHCADPLLTLRRLLLFTAGTLAVGIPLGLVVRGDAALWLREGMPGTWVSGVMLLAAAVAARGAYRREAGHPPVLASFWGLSASILALLVAVELFQPTIFIGHWLEDHGNSAPLGIADVDAMLMILLLAGVGLLLAPRALVLLHHRGALALLAIAVMIGMAVQGIDSIFPVSETEFVIEDSLKALGMPFLVCGYLWALRDHLSSGD